MRRGGLPAAFPEEARQTLIAWWQICQGKPCTSVELCASVETDELRLAWGIELLARGASLFRRRGMRPIPVEAGKVNSDPGLARHLDLLDAGAGKAVSVNGQRGKLTGRSTWRLFEVVWEDGEQAESKAVYLLHSFRIGTGADALTGNAGSSDGKTTGRELIVNDITATHARCNEHGRACLPVA